MHTAVLEAITKDAVAYTADKGVVGILDQWDKELLMFAIAQMKMVQTWDAAERLRLFDLVRFCRHKLFEENLITPEEFSDILAEGSVSAPDGGSVRRLESYDQMRQCITALEAERDALKSRLLASIPDNGLMEKVRAVSAQWVPLDEEAKRFIGEPLRVALDALCDAFRKDGGE